jgi:hypothetical protein
MLLARERLYSDSAELWTILINGVKGLTLEEVKRWNRAARFQFSDNKNEKMRGRAKREPSRKRTDR